MFQTILFLEQLLDFADTAGAMLLTQGIVTSNEVSQLIGPRRYKNRFSDFQVS